MVPAERHTDQGHGVGHMRLSTCGRVTVWGRVGTGDRRKDQGGTVAWLVQESETGDLSLVFWMLWIEEQPDNSY